MHHRSLLVNCYPAVSATQRRLDFSYYEYPDISHFVEARDPPLTPPLHLLAWVGKYLG